MNNRFSRFMTATVLAFSLWSSAIAVVALPVPQQDKQATQQNSKTKQDNKSQASTPAPKSNGMALSTDEDPSMIGKRNINHGIIAKMAGSLNK
ncbi:MAG: hypothetical protein M3362_23785, partial [Acidobacteriota bacterium]|nr:hypothetical protein [Acidobacteriota bacterium]